MWSRKGRLFTINVVAHGGFTINVVAQGTAVEFQDEAAQQQRVPQWLRGTLPCVHACVAG